MSSRSFFNHGFLVNYGRTLCQNLSNLSSFPWAFSHFYSSNVNDVIRAILKSLLFYEKISHAQKAQKAQRRNQAKAEKAEKGK